VLGVPGDPDAVEVEALRANVPGLDLGEDALAVLDTADVPVAQAER